MAIYFVQGFELDDFTGTLSSNTSSTTPTPYIGTSTTLSALASPIPFKVDDDDPNWEDAFIETGNLALLTEDVTVNGTTYPAGTKAEVEFALVTDDATPITFYVVRFGPAASNSGDNVMVVSDAPLTPGQTYTFASGFDGPSVPYDTICFAEGTHIETPAGPRPIETLAEGDHVMVIDGKARPIEWIGTSRFSRAEVERADTLRPVRIKAGALGPDIPRRDVVVSPQHRILVASAQAEAYFGSDQVLVSAKALVDGETVLHEPPGPVRYFHIYLSDHDLVATEGVWSETLLPGPQALSSLRLAHQLSLRNRFPEMFAPSASPQTCRPTIKAWEYALLSA